MSGPFDPWDLFESEELNDEHNILAIQNRLTRPEELPATKREKHIDLAERALKIIRQEEGHHEGVRKSMERWVNEKREAGEDVEEQRRIIFSMGPDERNFCTLNGEVEERDAKADVIIEWAREVYEGVVEDATIEQHDWARDKWREEFDRANKARVDDKFRRDPPEQYEGWERLDVAHDHVEVAYRADVHGTPAVAAVFEGEDGELEALEYTLEMWREAGGDPHEIRHPNRHVVSVVSDRGIYGDFRNHLATFTTDSEKQNSGSQAKTGEA